MSGRFGGSIPPAAPEDETSEERLAPLTTKEETTERTKAKKTPWTAEPSFSISMNMAVLGPTPVWVIKHAKKPLYLRIVNSGKAISVKSARLATRFDSKLWVQCTATWYADTKIVRLITKTEKEIREASMVEAQVWTFPNPEVCTSKAGHGLGFVGCNCAEIAERAAARAAKGTP